MCQQQHTPELSTHFETVTHGRTRFLRQPSIQQALHDILGCMLMTATLVSTKTHPHTSTVGLQPLERSFTATQALHDSLGCTLMIATLVSTNTHPNSTHTSTVGLELLYMVEHGFMAIRHTTSTLC